MHDRISINSLCFGKAPLAEVAEYWRNLGARRISLVGAQLLADPAPVAALVADGVVVETVAHVVNYGALTPEMAPELRGRLMEIIHAASLVQSRSIYLLTGARGPLDWEGAADLFSEIVAPCVARAQASGVRLLVENAPFLFADFHFAHSLRDAITLAQVSGAGLNVDLYGCWGEAGLSSLLRKAAPLAGLVQLSDHVPGDRALPARAVPGDGAIPIESMVRELLEAGYEGAFDIELLGPRIDSEGHLIAARRAADWVSALLNRLGA